VIPLTTLPGPVQTALQGVGANGQVGSVTQIQGVNGPIYRAQVTENGIPMELQISQTGQILSRTPGAASVGPVSAAAQAPTTLGNVQAGLPLSSLPEAVQSSLQTQLGANGQVQTVSRDDLANGTLFRVTTTQNGVPTEMRFAANGTFLGSAPINGTVTSPFLATGGVLPGTAVVMSDLPTGVQSAVRSQLGNGRLNQLTQLQGTNGVMYAVSYDVNGRPMVMTIGPDGRVISNNPITGVGGAGNRSSGTGSSINSTTRTNNSNRTSMRMEELPTSVQDTLRREARGAEVRSITREKRVGGDIYTVSVRGDNNAGELTIAQDGKVVTDNRRTFAELTVPKATLDDEKVTGIPYSTVPVAIQNAIKAYATASDIRSIQLGSDADGRTIYDVIYYHNGQRDRMIVQKDGTVRRIEQNVSPALEIPDAKKAPVIAIGDLPQAVRDTIRRQTEGVAVKDISTKQVGSETVYQVHYRTNGAPVELLVATDGRVVLPEGSLDREAAGAPEPASVAREELASAKVIPASDAPARTENTGTAASSERGSVNSNVTTSGAPSTQSAPASNVSISDVPQPVQNTAKKLAGSATIDSISPKLSDAGVTYEVAFLQNGARKTVVVNKDGVVINE
jgi:uncharacterized membrane protein YkoI